ncbi:SAM-dependent methyltransferase [Halobacteriales archaeon SW_7_71_33]|nr:MAG: SAM-dependent methyltransferase [Halobacteriales archaeon SW_7_71_33]
MSEHSASGTERESVPEQILDAMCGGRTIWLPGHKDDEDTLYIDKREEEPGFHGQEGRTYGVQPDEREDFRDLPYADESFNLVVFDPPHVLREDGMSQLSGHIIKKYGALRAQTWQSDLQRGFEDNEVDFRDVLNLAPADPLFGTTTKKNSKVENRWFVFYKRETQRNSRPVSSGTAHSGSEEDA